MKMKKKFTVALLFINLFCIAQNKQVSITKSFSTKEKTITVYTTADSSNLRLSLTDKLTFKAADIATGGGSFVRALQNGNMQQYAMYIGVGIVVVLSFVLMG